MLGRCHHSHTVPAEVLVQGHNSAGTCMRSLGCRAALAYHVQTV